MCSKDSIFCAVLSSKTWKSSAARSWTGAPFFVAYASTRTKFVSVRNRGGGCGGCDCWDCGDWPACASQTATATAISLDTWDTSRTEAGSRSVLRVELRSCRAPRHVVLSLGTQPFAIRARPFERHPLFLEDLRHQHLGAVHDVHFDRNGARHHDAPYVGRAALETPHDARAWLHGVAHLNLCDKRGDSQSVSGHDRSPQARLDDRFGFFRRRDRGRRRGRTLSRNLRAPPPPRRNRRPARICAETRRQDPRERRRTLQCDEHGGH